jgi:acetyl-CoA synthetase
MKGDYDGSGDKDALTKELVVTVRKHIGPFATPKRIIIAEDLPKTRSGKIMRRILRKIASDEGDQLGDLSSLANPAIVEELKDQHKKMTGGK